MGCMIAIWKKELRADSGGPGRFRGGAGQVMQVAHRLRAPFTVFARYDRVYHPPRGRAGGKNGANGRVGLSSGRVLRPKGAQTVPAGETLVIEMPGGGGYGDPSMREAARVADDVRNGIVTRAAARRKYGVVIRKDGSVDQRATARLRA